MLFEEMLGCDFQLLVPFLSETAYQWLFEELIRSYTLCAPQHFGTFAYLPAMEIYGREGVILFDSDRIEGAGYRFEESRASLPSGFFQGAEADTAGSIGGENAVSPIDN